MPPDIHGLYVIIDPTACAGRDPVVVAADALEGGASALQWRDKSRPLGDQLDDVRALRALCTRHGAVFIINDHLDLALATGADGIHVGQHDLPVELVRQVAGDALVVGVSTNNAEEALRAAAGGASYVAVGAIFPTASKANTRPADLDRITSVRQAVALPVVAIGGIDASNARDAFAAGADAVAVISAVCAAPDVRTAAREIAAAARTRLQGNPSLLAVTHAYIDALNARDLERFASLFAPDGLMEDPVTPGPYIGRDGIAEWWRALGLADRPFSINVRDIFTVRAEAVISWEIPHTHGHGEPALASGVEVISIEDSGLIASSHSLWSRPSGDAGPAARRVARDYIDALNARDRDRYLALWAPDGMRQDPDNAAPLIGLQALASAFDAMIAAFPPFTITIDDICAAQSEAAIVWHLQHHGDAGTPHVVRGVSVIEIDGDERIAALYSYWNQGAMLPERAGA